MIPSPLLDDIIGRKCLLFIGAGFSLNADLPQGKTMVDWDQLVEKLAHDLGTITTDPLEIAEEYQKSFGRPKLIEALEKILQVHIIKPGNVHKHFVKSRLFDVIYTTNFDTLLEDACEQEKIQYRTIATPKQISLFQGPPTINIIKMHGELPDIEYLVFTKTDYENYEKNYETVIVHLKGLLTTKTVLFLGYSLRDPNFQQIKQMIEKMMGTSIRKNYIVLLNANETRVSEYEKMNLHVINLQSDTKSNDDLLLDFINEIANYPSQKFLPREMEISAHKSVVIYGETFEIRAHVSKIIDKPINLVITSPENEVVYRGIVDKKLKENIGIKQIVVRGPKWHIGKEYSITAEYDGKTVQDKILISDQLPIVIQTDKSIYMYNSDIAVTIINPNHIVDVPINLEIFGPENKLVYKNAIPVKQFGTGIYQDIILVGGKDWSRVPGSRFKIMAEFNGQTAEVDIYTSDFGATVILDQKVYTWTDRVYITVVAPDFNRDPNISDIIGDNEIGKITISTNEHRLSSYKLVETGPDTGIFTGYVTLTGNPILKGQGGVDGAGNKPSGTVCGEGPTDGLLSAKDNDKIEVSFEITKDKKSTASAMVRWNIGQIAWLKSSYQVNSQGILQIIDPDMNLNPNVRDKFLTKIWSDSDPKGIVLTMTETGENTGIFQGIVNFNAADGKPSDISLKVIEGDTVTAEYIDRTLPPPYTSADQLRLTATSFIGAIVTPLERVSILNSRMTDFSGRTLTSAKINQEIQIISDLINEQDRNQPFTYFVQVKNIDDVQVFVSNISGNIPSKQSHTAMRKWIPTALGTYKIQIFVWQSVDNPNALSPPLQFKIKVV